MNAAMRITVTLEPDVAALIEDDEILRKLSLGK